MPACVHSFLSPGESSPLIYTAADWQGPVAGLLGCEHCSMSAAIRLLDWTGARLEQRVYSLALVDEAATATFIRDMNRGYCDPARKSAEWQALVSMHPATHAGLFLLPERRCVKSLPLQTRPVYPDWTGLPASDATSSLWTQFQNSR